MRRHPSLIALAALIWAVALSACGGAPAAQSPTAPPAAPPTEVPAAPTAPPTDAPAAPTSAPAPTAVPTVAPTSAPTVAPTGAPTAAPTVAPTVAPTAAPTVAPRPAGASEVLFLRQGVLVAIDPATGAERALVDGVGDFAATPDGRLLAVVRGEGAAAELWLVGRDGGGLRQLTTNDRAEATPSWSPDGLSLAYTAAPALAPRAPDWQSWSAWCADAEVRLLDTASGSERAIGAGCEPVFSPDGRRLAFTSPPTAAAPGTTFAGAANTVTVVNREGANGWSLARSDGQGLAEGYLVHGPAWAPDGGRVAYQRFLGYQALTDINLTEAGSAFQRKAEPIGFGAGWLLTPSYAPDGRQVAVVEHNFSDARGFTGYDSWRVSLLRLGGQEELPLPNGPVTLQATRAATLMRATAAAWSPDGVALVVVLPAGWRADASEQEPLFGGDGPGELWRWRPEGAPDQRLAEGVDFGSPVLWLPAP